MSGRAGGARPSTRRPGAAAAALTVAGVLTVLAAGPPAAAAPSGPAAADGVFALRPSAAAAAHAEGPPPGHAGGFGEPTCHVCHGEYEVGLDGTLTVEGLPERYRPGETYALTLVLESAGMERAGFQAAFRRAAGDRAGTPAGTATAVGDAVLVRTGRDGGSWIQHAPGGLWTGGEVASWSFTWTAPASDEGPVAFHAAANSANGDNSPFGDIVYIVADTVAGPPAGRR